MQHDAEAADAELDDVELVGRIVAGDERALMAVYDRHGDALYGIAVRFLGDRETAAEVVQEVFLSLWQRASRFDAAAGSLIGWLIGIARHRSLDRLRAESRRPRRVRDFPGGLADASVADPETGLLARGARSMIETGDGDPATELDRRWARSVVRSALAEMPEHERHVLVLAYDEDLTQSQIAARLGWPIGTVKSRTRRAMAMLRARLVSIPELTDR